MSLSNNFVAKYGPWAVVTGASSGIGVAFAKNLAAAGLSVVLVARRKERMDAVAADIAKHHPGVETKVVVADLSVAEGVDAVISGTRGLEVGLLVNNAGVECHGLMIREPLEKHLRMIALNVEAVTALAYHFGAMFAGAGRGGILFVSSVAAHAMPLMATYSATKAFVSTLSYTLRYELGAHGVTVMALEPGLVESEMSDRVADEVDFAKLRMPSQTADRCASVALYRLAEGKMRTTPGRRNTVIASISRALPKRITISVMGAVMKRVMPPHLFKFAEKST